MPKGNSKKEKRVRFGAEPSHKKNPVITPGGSFNHLNPSWRINRLQFLDPYGFHELNVIQTQYIRQKLADFESMDWNQIFVIAKKQNHCLKVEELKCPRARRWMRENMPDQDHLWTLRLSGAERIWGILSQGVFNIIFWDPEHLIWETGPNT